MEQSLQMVTAAMKLKDACFSKESNDKSTAYFKLRCYLPAKVHLVKAMVFLVVMYECENWIIKSLSAEELMLLNCCVGEDS